MANLHFQYYSSIQCSQKKKLLFFFKSMLKMVDLFIFVETVIHLDTFLWYVGGILAVLNQQNNSNKTQKWETEVDLTHPRDSLVTVAPFTAGHISKFWRLTKKSWDTTFQCVVSNMIIIGQQRNWDIKHKNIKISCS